MPVFYGTEVASPLMLGTAGYPSPAILAEAFALSRREQPRSCKGYLAVANSSD